MYNQFFYTTLPEAQHERNQWEVCTAAAPYILNSHMLTRLNHLPLWFKKIYETCSRNVFKTEED